MTRGLESMTAGIAGLGLIGGSTGLALRQKAGCPKVIGFDPDLKASADALAAGCVHELVSSVDQLAKADLVFVAVPPRAVKGTLDAVEKARGDRTVATDCTGAKAKVAEWASQDASRGEWFVGGHPMAGNEGSGAQFASADLFEGAPWVLTPFGDPDSDSVRTLVEVVRSLGAFPVTMSAADHDRHVAVLSHLPHAIAGALLASADDLDSPDVGGGSWRDLTRVGGSNPALWQQLFLDNRQAILAALESFGASLAELKEALEHNDGEQVRAFFEEARQAKKRQGSAR